MIADLSIVGFPFLIGVAVLTAAAVASAIGFRHHMNRLATAAVWLMIVALLAGNAAGWVNRHFDSVRTVDELFGRTAQDQSSVAAIARQKVVPKHGRVINIPVPATRSGFAARDALVYLPPAWFETPRPHLPDQPGTPTAVPAGLAASPRRHRGAASMACRSRNGRAPS